MKDKIKFDDFLEISSKLEMKAGKVVDVLIIKKKRVIQLMVDFGSGPVSVLTNIKDDLGEDFKEKLLGLTFLFVTNLEPMEMFNLESVAMIVPGQIKEFGITSIDTEIGNIFM